MLLENTIISHFFVYFNYAILGPKMRKIMGLIGYPLEHSVSPAMHNAAFKKLGLDCEYSLFEVEPKDLPEAVEGMRALHIAGFNVTIPHKEAVVPLLDEVTEVAKVIGAVNTVKNQRGRLIGYNTDGAGFIESLKNDAKIKPKGKHAVVLGAGGASRAVAVMLAESGAKTVTITDIDNDKARELAEYVDSYFDTSCVNVEVNGKDLQGSINQAEILVNCTPLGMAPKIKACPLADNIELHKKLMVYDLVYNPAETALMKKAKAAGAKVCSGLGMLVYQGALALTLWTGEEAPIEVMRQAAQAALK